MKTHINTLREIKYKGHIIRKVETETMCTFVLIDCDRSEVELAPALMQVDEFPYASVADAKRCISNGWAAQKYVVTDVVKHRRNEYINRFVK